MTTPYRPPKLWRPGEPFSPFNFNTYVSGNMDALADRPGHAAAVVAGGTDLSFTNTSHAEHPDATNRRVTLEVFTKSLIVLTVQATYRVSTTANRIISLDWYWVEKDVYLSTMTSTPAGQGLSGILRMGDIGQNLGYGFQWWQPDVPEGIWNFDLYIRVNANTATEERSDAPFFVGGFVF